MTGSGRPVTVHEPVVGELVDGVPSALLVHLAIFVKRRHVSCGMPCAQVVAVTESDLLAERCALDVLAVVDDVFPFFGQAFPAASTADARYRDRTVGLTAWINTPRAHIDSLILPVNTILLAKL